MLWKYHQILYVHLSSCQEHHKKCGTSTKQLADDTIKNGTVVENVSGIIDTTTFAAKKGLDECIHHIKTAWTLEVE